MHSGIALYAVDTCDVAFKKKKIRYLRRQLPTFWMQLNAVFVGSSSFRRANIGLSVLVDIYVPASSWFIILS